MGTEFEEVLQPTEPRFCLRRYPDFKFIAATFSEKVAGNYRERDLRTSSIRLSIQQPGGRRTCPHHSEGRRWMAKRWVDETVAGGTGGMVQWSRRRKSNTLEDFRNAIDAWKTEV